MGLAASQARLLFITSRQNDVSAKMQRISNQTMILARDEEDVVSKYNQMLNATKFQTSNGVDISYGALMGTANAALGSDPTFITAANGALVLNDNYFNKLGIDPKKISGTEADFGVNKNTFISNITGKTLEEIQACQDTQTLSKEEWLETDAGKDFIATNGARPVVGDKKTEEKKFEGTSTDFFAKLHKNGESATAQDLGWWNATTNTDYDDDGKHVSHTLNVSTMTNSSSWGSIIELNSSSYLGQVNTIIDNIAKSINESDEFKNSEEIKTAVETARLKTRTQFGQDPLKQESGVSRRSRSNTYRDKVQDKAQANDRICYGKGTRSWNDGGFYFVSLARIANYFYESMVNALNNTTNGVDGNKNNSTSSFTYNVITEEKTQEDLDKWNKLLEEEYDKYLESVASESEVDPGLLSQYNYFSKIYDKAAKAWVYDANVNQNLNTNLQNGTYRIDGQLAQENDSIVEVADEDAEKEAERYYDQEIRKINRKEKQLEQDLTKLQTEYSSLTTDYESVKSIIQANVSKSFTYCQNG